MAKSLDTLAYKLDLCENEAIDLLSEVGVESRIDYAQLF
jgi:hypothetical protein